MCLNPNDPAVYIYSLSMSITQKRKMRTLTCENVTENESQWPSTTVTTRGTNFDLYWRRTHRIHGIIFLGYLVKCVPKIFLRCSHTHIYIYLPINTLKHHRQLTFELWFSIVVIGESFQIGHNLHQSEHVLYVCCSNEHMLLNIAQDIHREWFVYSVPRLIKPHASSASGLNNTKTIKTGINKSIYFQKEHDSRMINI